LKTRTLTTRNAAEFINAPPRKQVDLSDAMLVECVLKGDQAAFELLVQRHQAALFRRARWMGLDAETAADMVQDTLVKAYQNLRQCRDRDRFGFWAGRILRNRVLDFLKSAERRGVRLSLCLSDVPDPELEHARTNLRSALHEALALLPDEQREAFLLKHVEGCSYEEMADLAETSLSAMKMRVHRARETLRAHLSLTAPDDEM
jgi:RNA polymerase sigma-70 factor (ECF subfamily)